MDHVPSKFSLSLNSALRQNRYLAWPPHLDLHSVSQCEVSVWILGAPHFYNPSSHVCVFVRELRESRLQYQTARMMGTLTEHSTWFLAVSLYGGWVWYWRARGGLMWKQLLLEKINLEFKNELHTCGLLRLYPISLWNSAKVQSGFIHSLTLPASFNQLTVGCLHLSNQIVASSQSANHTCAANVSICSPLSHRHWLSFQWFNANVLFPSHLQCPGRVHSSSNWELSRMVILIWKAPFK